MNVPLTTANGGQAAIVENQGDHVTLRSSVPSPPGSSFSLKHGDIVVLVKVRGCKRLDESELPFRIEGRFVSLTRAARDVLFATGSVSE